MLAGKGRLWILWLDVGFKEREELITVWE